MAQSVHIILESIDLIAQDLSLCISDYDPHGLVLVAANADRALEMVQGRASITLAIIHADPTGFSGTPLGRALASKGAQCIFMGDRAERSPADALVLERPFSSQTVFTFLQTINLRAAA